jgi:hypothetical protein
LSFKTLENTNHSNILIAGSLVNEGVRAINIPSEKPALKGQSVNVYCMAETGN